MRHRITTMASLVKKQARSEDGIALIVVIGVLMLLTVLAIGLIYIAEQNISLSSEGRHYTRSLGVAEAGLERLLWDLRENGMGSIEQTFTITSAQLGAEGTATVRVLSSGGFFVKAVSVGEYKEKRKGVECVLFSTNIWEMNFAGGTSQSLQTGTSGLTGNVEFIGPLFVRGNLPIGGNTDITVGPLFIDGGRIVKESGSSNVGIPGQHVTAYINGNPPVTDKNGATIPQSSWFSNNLYLDPFNAWCPSIILPTLDGGRLTTDRSRAYNESLDGLGDHATVYPQEQVVFPTINSGAYKVLDSDGSNAAVGAGAFGVTLSSSTPSFGLVDWNGDGLINETDEVHWHFAWWNPDSYVLPPGVTSISLDSTRTIYVYSLETTGTGEIKSTTYIDGPLTIDGTTGYKGRGTIVANGNITINGKLLSSNFPTVNALGIVGAKDMIFNIPSPEDDIDDAQGAFFVLGKVYFNNNYQKIKGTIIGGQFVCNQKPKLEVNPDLPDNLPPSLPGNPKDDGYLNAVTSWREVQPPW